MHINSGSSINGYNGNTFEDLAPAYLLGVDASGNVVQSPFSGVSYVGRTRFSAGTIQIGEFYNSTGATISINNTGVGVYTITASSGVFLTNTAVFVQLQTAGFVTAIRTSSTVITINTYNTAGVANDAVIAAGSFVKIEVYP